MHLLLKILSFTSHTSIKTPFIRAKCTYIQTQNFYLELFFWSYQVFLSLVNLKLLLGEKKNRKKEGRKKVLHYLFNPSTVYKEQHQWPQPRCAVCRMSCKNNPLWHESISLYKHHENICHFYDYDLDRSLLVFQL